MIRKLFHNLLVALGALTFTGAFFFVLPLIQAIATGPQPDTVLTEVGAANIPPPPPTMEEEPEPEPEPEEEEPELKEEQQNLSLDQLDNALNADGLIGDGFLKGEFVVDLNKVTGGAKELDELFSLADLDQTPRPIYQASPSITKKMRKKAPGKVYILFVVDQRGRVQDAKVQQSTDPIFNHAALKAVKKWKFEPGKRSGKAVRFRMRVPISFPK